MSTRPTPLTPTNTYLARSIAGLLDRWAAGDLSAGKAALIAGETFGETIASARARVRIVRTEGGRVAILERWTPAHYRNGRPAKS